jgi:hypothetical protein
MQFPVFMIFIQSDIGNRDGIFIGTIIYGKNGNLLSGRKKLLIKLFIEFKYNVLWKKSL